MLNPLNLNRGLSGLQFVKTKSIAPLETAPTEAKDEVVKAEITDTPFDGFLKYKNYDVEVADGDIFRKFRGGFVHGPGHHIAAVAAFAFDQQMNPYAILKTGDTRLSRAERNEPYVQDGFVAGRMDKKGAESSKIALAELAEEVGGTVLGDTFRPLGTHVNPTMPFESTEGDNYYIAAVKLDGNPYGDGGGMEAVDLIGPKLLNSQDAIAAMDDGSISEGSRTRALYGRGFDSIGYVPKLGAYVHDHPELLKKFDTLGLGEVLDLRQQSPSSSFPEQGPAKETLESQINDVVSKTRNVTELSRDAAMVDAKTRHVVNKDGTITEVGKEFPNQYLKLNYDRAKVANYYVDAKKGPMIQMRTQARPALAFAPDSPKVMRLDVTDIEVSRDSNETNSSLDGARELGQASGASPGQTDLYYQFWAKAQNQPENPEKEGYIPLSQAVKLCRTGHGDVQTEALLERLADDLEWIPNLDMSVADAKKLMAD